MTPDPIPTRCCSACHRELALSEFGRRFHGNDAVRLSACKNCRNERQRQFRAAQRSKQLAEFSRRIRDENKAAAVVRLAAEMVARFGGVQRFASIWFANYQQSKQGSRNATNSLLAIFKVVQAVDESKRANRPRLESFTDAELDNLARQQMRELFANLPANWA